MNDPYNNFFIKARQTVYKWWCVIYKPVYKLTHNGYWPVEKEPGYKPPAEDPKQKELATQMATQIMANKQNSVNDMVLQAASTPASHEPMQASPIQSTPTENIPVEEEPAFDTSNVDADALARAEEIMARLNKEAAEDEAKKQAEIDQAKQAAKKNAEEQARLAEIMKANQVDISAFIEEGKESQAAEQKKLAQIMKANQVDISAFIEEGKEKQKETNYTIS